MKYLVIRASIEGKIVLDTAPTATDSRNDSLYVLLEQEWSKFTIPDAVQADLLRETM
jgi:hypothetical protein